MLLLFALLAEAPPTAPTDDVAALEALLTTWAEQKFRPFVLAARPQAQPSTRFAVLPSARWGPDAIFRGQTTCLAFNDGDPAENGLTRSEIDAACARLGPDWASAP